MKRSILGVFALIGLSACANLDPATADRNLQKACTAYNIASTALPAIVHLSAEQQKAVEIANALVAPTCASGHVPTNTNEAIAIVITATITLYDIINANK